MYTNIDASHAIEVISKWLDSVPLPEGFPLVVVKTVMELVMCNNIFEWGDSYFLQLLGTAMGTSAACTQNRLHNSKIWQQTATIFEIYR